MTLAPKIALGLMGLALVAGGAGLWTRFGSLVHFDVIAAAFVGCFLVS
jgi:hypothetical protein